MYRKKLSGFMVIAVLVLSVCNFPSAGEPEVGEGDQILTAAAETIEAQFTQQPVATTPTTAATFTPTNTLFPTNTSVPAATAACDLATFIADLTVPDGTEFEPNEDFTKSWRLRNAGTCTWTSSYQVVFDSGTNMGGPASQQLTAGSVAPNGTVDISINLAAPSTPGTYKGNYRLRNASGVTFGLSSGGPFFVEIKVVEDDGTDNLVPSDDGSVRSNGSVLNPPNVGDTNGDIGSEAFVRFDISDIPGAALITDVVIDIVSFDTLGNPFGSLGCLHVYPGDFFPLGADDYVGVPAPSQGAVRWCNTTQLNNKTSDDDMVAALQDAVGADDFDLRFQFIDAETDNDGESDMVRIIEIRLIVTYEEP
jgi:hypothetical protein